MKTIFDAKKFLIDEFVDPPSMRAAFNAQPALPAPNEPTLRKWFQRGSIPSEWLAVLLLMRERQNRMVKLSNYVRTLEEARQVVPPKPAGRPVGVKNKPKAKAKKTAPKKPAAKPANLFE